MFREKVKRSMLSGATSH